MNASIQCNNVGLTLLETGRLKDALETFKYAAQMLYPVSRCMPSSRVTTIQELPMHLMTTFHTSHPQTMIDLFQSIRERLSSNNQSTAQVDVTRGNCFVYAKPFQLEELKEVPCSCTLESAVIVYNMGLTYHLTGSFDGFQKSLMLYDLAFSLAYSSELSYLSSHVAMAALNNAGQIQHALGSYDISRIYLDSLSNYVLGLPPTEYESELSVRRQFLLNAVLLEPPITAAAA